MNSLCRPLLIALAALMGGTAPARAAWLGYSNDTRVPLIVQVSTVINNQERKSQPRPINPRERSFEPILVPGVKVVFLTVLDGQLRPLGKFPVNFVGRDIFYSIQVDAVGTQVNKSLTLQLHEVRLPPPGPGPQPFPGAMPFPGMMPGFQPGMPGLPQPGVPQPGTTPIKPTVPQPPTSTTTPTTPKKD